ncbi:MAG TPA: hypothetical protein P5137_17380, partial [Candidatus Brocadiia bacterium]|nr:hypothetical protein [Candidatus Brocadiia bacterium]
MKPRPDLADARTMPGVEVFQLTEGPLPNSHVYMEAQVFAPDSKRFVLHGGAYAHGYDHRDPKRKYLLCDLEQGGRLSPLTEEVGACAPAVSPDGRFLYYFVDETAPQDGRLTLKRVGLDGSDRRTLAVLEGPRPETGTPAAKVYPLSTISSDGRRLALGAFFSDGKTEGNPWGLLVFDLETGAARALPLGHELGNPHMQYCRSTCGERSRDIMVQHDHGNAYSPLGEMTRRQAAAADLPLRLSDYARAAGRPPEANFSGLGIDIHVMRDDGSNPRSMPWGRDGNERLQGHQCWRGQSEWAITSTDVFRPEGRTLVEGRAVQASGHDGLLTPGAERNVLSRGFANPRFYHFATDRE